MCDLNGPFKVCTCESIADRSKPHWVLHRTLIQKDENNFIIGMLIGPNPYELYLSKNLKKRLNSCNVFDFEYQPQEGDCLELFTETISDPEDELEVLKGTNVMQRAAKLVNAFYTIEWAGQFNNYLDYKTTLILKK